jgi:hypothetical protein
MQIISIQIKYHSFKTLLILLEAWIKISDVYTFRVWLIISHQNVSQNVSRELKANFSYKLQTSITSHCLKALKLAKE